MNNQQEQVRGDPMRDIIVGMVLFTAVFAPIGVVFGVIFSKLVKRRRYQPLYWLGALAISIALMLFDMHYRHVETDIVNYAVEIIRQFKHQTFSGPQLWPLAWPLWLESFPVFAYVAVLEALSSKTKAEITIRDQIRDQAASKYKTAERARKRTANMAAVPEAIHNKIVLGAPIDKGKE